MSSEPAGGSFGWAKGRKPDQPLVVDLEQVTKIYKIYARPLDRLREWLRPGARRHREFVALDRLDLKVHAGEALGIIGENGAGKSTLLKIVTKTTVPTRGRAQIHGRVSALLELGAGFHPEFSGRANVLMNAALSGIAEDRLQQTLDEIVEFSELGGFIDVPVKTYSTGMYMRLGFALATAVTPDILVVDEALSVGDQYFQRKCIERLKVFRERGGTLLFVSHNLNLVQLLCDHVIWLDDGRIAAAGEALPVVDAFAEHLRALEGRRKRGEEPGGPPVPLPHSGTAEDGGCCIRGVRLLDGEGRETSRFSSGAPLVVEIAYQAFEAVARPFFGVNIVRNDNTQCFGTGSHVDRVSPPVIEGKGVVRLVFPELELLKGTYLLTCAIYDAEVLVRHDFHAERYRFEVEQGTIEQGVARLRHHWEFAERTGP
jgi:ABC-type polysaccharide/polyol phosphate transport system ATPase subunit